MKSNDTIILLLLGGAALYFMNQNKAQVSTEQAQSAAQTYSETKLDTKSNTQATQTIIHYIDEIRYAGGSNADAVNVLIAEGQAPDSKSGSSDLIAKTVTPTVVTYSGASKVANDKAVKLATDWNTANRFNPTTGKFY